MVSQRLKQLRLARGLTLEALSAEMGGIVTRQSLLKYEQGKAHPSPIVLNRLAAALGVKAAHLWSEPDIRVEFIAYRKGAQLPKREQEKVESLISQTLEQRVHLQELIQGMNSSHLPVQKMPISVLEDAELAAEKIRTQWKLGQDPISSVTDMLEDHFIHVIEVNAGDSFDGMAAVAHDDGQHVAAAVVTRRGVAGERQRLNLTHELGHLVLEPAKNVDKEKSAFRFGTAFLAPADVLRREIGSKRDFIRSDELLLLKRRFGLSLQALLHRMNDLDIITDSYYQRWCIDINRLGWKKKEPLEMPAERPQWLRRSVLHALAEELITNEEAERILGEKLETSRPHSLTQRRAFLKLPIEERRQILAEQAEKMVAQYELNTEWKSLQAGDLVEY